MDMSYCIWDQPKNSTFSLDTSTDVLHSHPAHSQQSMCLMERFYLDVRAFHIQFVFEQIELTAGFHVSCCLLYIALSCCVMCTKLIVDHLILLICLEKMEQLGN
jgi:hypothetical protein